MASPIVGTIGFTILSLIVISVCIALIITLLRTISCTQSAPNSYEHFEDSALQQIQSRIESIKRIKQSIVTDLDTLNGTTDDTCAIMKKIENIQIKNYTSMGNKDARKRFNLEKSQYVALHKDVPLLECFTDSIVDAEQQLSGEIDALKTLMENADMKLALHKIEPTFNTLGFNAGYLKKMVNMSTEGFFTNLRGPELLASADSIIQQANDIHAKIIQVKETVDKQTTLANALFQKDEDLKQGKVDASDIANVESKTNIHKAN